ncbi:MAG TPA: PLP-dependent aminotransferase family protein [Candidatus Acidoferrales bacterium]
MAKRATSFELALPPKDSAAPAYRWLYAALRAAILEGRLHPASRLPATRDLATQYRLSRGTIVYAVEQLKSEGYVQARMGSGTYVSDTLPDELLQVRSIATPSPPLQEERHRSRRISAYAKRVHLFPTLAPRPSRAFRPNLPALELFPTTLWAQVAARRLRKVSTNFLLGCKPLGYLPLRQAVADYLSSSRGVNCVAEQVAIVSGAQEALDLVARLFVNPGDRVCMENPGYIGATAVFESLGAKISYVPLDDEGMELREATLRNARLVYVTPGHQFPLGITMSLPRRLQLLESARKSGALILEDDYDSEFRYAGRPVPALQGLDRHGLVLFTGSFSKVLFPSLRLGYLVLPHDVVDRFSATLSITRRHAPLMEQAILSDFITAGHFGRHLRRMRQIYAERLSVLLESARQNLAGLLEISGVEAGLQTVGWLQRGLDGELAAAAAAKRNVEVIPLSTYSHGNVASTGLQLGFAAVDAQEIRRGVQDLAIALQTARKTPRRDVNLQLP